MWINDQYFSFKQTLSGSIILSATSCDILIVGAGIAGISAAVTSAQKGFHTILLEKNIDFGGVIRSAYLNEMCGLFYADSMQSPIQLNSGLSKIFYNNLANVEKHSLKQNGKVYVLPFQRRNLFTQIDNMLKENSLLEYRNNQEMISLTRSSTMIKNVTVKNNLTSETYTIKPKIVIDCSGAGCVLSAAEQKDQEPICRQLAGVTIVLNCPARCDAVLSLKVPYFLNLAVSEGIFFDCIKYTTISQGENSNELNIKINIDSKNISFSDIN